MNMDNEVHSVGTEKDKSVSPTSKASTARGLGLVDQDGNKSSVMEKRSS